jgi:hypothetical protein
MSVAGTKQGRQVRAGVNRSEVKRKPEIGTDPDEASLGIWWTAPAGMRCRETNPMREGWSCWPKWSVASVLELDTKYSEVEGKSTRGCQEQTTALLLRGIVFGKP